MSSGVPTRRTGLASAAALRKSSTPMCSRSAVASVISVAMNPGAIVLTRSQHAPAQRDATPKVDVTTVRRSARVMKPRQRVCLGAPQEVDPHTLGGKYRCGRDCFRLRPRTASWGALGTHDNEIGACRWKTPKDVSAGQAPFSATIDRG